MGYNELEIELKKTLAQIARWRELGYMPTIEQGIALGRLQKIYAGLLDLPCCDPEEVPAVSDAPKAAAEPSPLVAVVGGEAAEPKTEEAGERVAEVAVVPETAENASQETGEQTATAVEESAPKELEKPAAEEAEASSASVAPAPAVAQQPQGGEAQPMPRVFGIEVSPYARHEMIDTLFHGNTALFLSEVAKLNEMGSLEEALVYIGETYRWIPENAATIKFIDLLTARFAE